MSKNNCFCSIADEATEPFIFNVFFSSQEILNDQRMAFDFLDILRIVFNYCGSKLIEIENNEMRGIVKDIIVILGYFTVNNRTNQVSDQQPPHIII